MAETTVPGIEVSDQSPERPGRFIEFWRYFRENRGAIVGLVFIGVVVFVAMMRDIGGGEGTGAAGRDMGGGGTLRAPDGRGGAAPKNEAGMSCSPRS
jgi:hypothetical protein